MITILCGDNEKEIDELYLEYKNKGNLIEYPEVRKHPRELYSVMLSEFRSEKDIIVKTFSDVIVNMLGFLIEHRIINNKEVELIIKTEGKIYICDYDEEGMLENYPSGFFLWGGF